MDGVLIRHVEIAGFGHADCRVTGSEVAEVGRGLSARIDEMVIEGQGGALMPGLADHHVHLSAMAAQLGSVDLSWVRGADVATVISESAPGPDGWVRAVGLDDPRGIVDREVVDRWRPEVPVRVQHRSGALWVLNGAGLRRVAAETARHPGLERDATGRPTGRMWRADDWLRDAIGTAPPRLEPVGRQLASLGVTHVSDATPGDWAGPLIVDAATRGELPQKIAVMGSTLSAWNHPRVTLGPRKIVVSDHEEPDLDGLVRDIATTHSSGRAVAVHCVTRVALAVTLAALDAAGVRPGDRIEHCAVADAMAAHRLAERGIRVVTQPTLVTSRGDDYWERSERADRDDLWPYAGLLAAGVRVAPSSDAPYGNPDPWACVRAAVERMTPSGRVLNAGERVPASTAFAGLLSALDDPGGWPRRVGPGQPADLVLLDRSLEEALRDPDARCVRATLIDGAVIYRR